MMSTSRIVGGWTLLWVLSGCANNVGELSGSLGRGRYGYAPAGGPTTTQVADGGVAMPPAAERAWSRPVFEASFIVPEIRSTKFPYLGAVGDRILLGASNQHEKDHNRATLVSWNPAWNATAADGNLATFEEVGDAGGQADYASTSVSTGPDGSIYLAWTNQKSHTVHIRRKAPDGTWQADITVFTHPKFVPFVRANVASDGRLFVLWNCDSHIYYLTSTTQGTTWEQTAPQIASGEVNVGGFPAIATDDKGHVAIAYGGGEPTIRDDGGRLYVGIWNGSGFSKEVPQVRDEPWFFADPTLSITADQTVHVAWRDVEKRIWYAARSLTAAPESWKVEVLAGIISPDDPQKKELYDGLCDVSYGATAISSDAAGNLHLFWEWSGNHAICYTFKPKGGSWQMPVAQKTDVQEFNTSAKATIIGDRLYAFAAVENLGGEAPMQAKIYRFVGTPQ